MARLSSLVVSAILLLTSVSHAQTLKRLEILPGPRTIYAPSKTQQLAAIAHFADGSSRDVTRMTRFSSDDDQVATIDSRGRVHFHQAGEVAILGHYQTIATLRLKHVEPKPGYTWPNPPQHNFIDRLLFSQLKELGIAPAKLCTDEVFVRRAYLVACGILPTPAETLAFLADRKPDKRARLIDRLLERPEYAECWAHHWTARPELEHWRMPTRVGAAVLDQTRGKLAAEVPLDRIVREWLQGTQVVTDHGPGSYYNGARTSEEWAARTAQAFLGIRMQCVSCHVVPQIPATADDVRHFTAFFAQLEWKASPVGNKYIQILTLTRPRELTHSITKKPVPPRFPDGTSPRLRPDQDRREVLAEWVASPDNRWFARTLANRIWHHVFGKGLAHALDSVNENRRTANDELLDALARELVACRFDNKHMVRLMMNSHAWQLAGRRVTHKEYEGKHFSHAYDPMLKREVLMDALTQMIETPEVFAGMPLGTRAVQLLDANRPVFFGGFSRPQRIAACEDEPTSDRGAAETEILHGEPLRTRMLDPNNRFGRLLREKRTDREIVDELFLAAFARLPDDKLRAQALAHIAKAKDRRTGCDDIIWALINTHEFVRRP